MEMEIGPGLANKVYRRIDIEGKRRACGVVRELGIVHRWMQSRDTRRGSPIRRLRVVVSCGVVVIVS